MDLWCRNNHLKKGRGTKSMSNKIKYYSCGVRGCAKGYRTITRSGDILINDDFLDDVPVDAPVYSVEDITSSRKSSFINMSPKRVIVL